MPLEENATYTKQLGVMHLSRTRRLCRSILKSLLTRLVAAKSNGSEGHSEWRHKFELPAPSEEALKLRPSFERLPCSKMSKCHQPYDNHQKPTISVGLPFWCRFFNLTEKDLLSDLSVKTRLIVQPVKTRIDLEQGFTSQPCTHEPVPASHETENLRLQL